MLLDCPNRDLSWYNRATLNLVEATGNTGRDALVFSVIEAKKESPGSGVTWVMIASFWLSAEGGSLAQLFLDRREDHHASHQAACHGR